MRRMMLFALLVLTFTVTFSASHAQTTSTEPMPDGIFLAVQDLGGQVGVPIEIVCEDVTNSSTCNATDPRLQWFWESAIYTDSSLGCPAAVANDSRRFLGFRYEFTWNGRIPYSYRDARGGNIFRCDATALVQIAENGNLLRPLPPTPVPTPTIVPGSASDSAALRANDSGCSVESTIPSTLEVTIPSPIRQPLSRRIRFECHPKRLIAAKCEKLNADRADAEAN